MSWLYYVYSQETEHHEGLSAFVQLVFSIFTVQDPLAHRLDRSSILMNSIMTILHRQFGMILDFIKLEIYTNHHSSYYD